MSEARQEIALAYWNAVAQMDGLERIRDLLENEEIELAAWAVEHESWAVVLWRAEQSGHDLTPEVYGPYRSGATAMIAGERMRAARLT
jgi:hypothetical protein